MAGWERKAFARVRFGEGRVYSLRSARLHDEERFAMSAEFRKKLREDPLELLLKKYSLHPADNIGDYKGTELDSRNTTGFTGQKITTKHSQVSTNKKVAFIDLNKRQRGGVGQTGNEGGDCVDVTGQYAYKKDWVPVYFLPWDQGGAIVQLTIPRVGEISRESNVYDPDIFFTAAINGCSIFVQGSPERPTIYHAGGDTGRGKHLSASAGFWREMLINFADTTKGKIVTEVNKMDYIKNPNAQGDGGPTTQHALDYKRFLESAHKNVLKVESVFPWGCVMGIRTDGRWRFFLQENATVQYMTFTKKHWFSKKQYGQVTLLARPMAVREIYPNSTGIVDMTPALPHRVTMQ